MTDTARIAVVIPDPFIFTPIAPGQATSFVQPYLVLQDSAGGAVSLSGDTSTRFSFGNTAVTGWLCDAQCSITITSRKGVDLQYTVLNADGSPASYLLTGVMLKNAADGSAVGTVFPKVTVDVTGSNTGTLTLEDRPGSGNSTTSYELWLLLQGSAGLGLIDPRIVNQAS
jgi:hypothetical protein